MSEEKNKHTLLKVIGVTAAAGAAAYGGFGYLVFRNAFDLQHSAIYGNTTKKMLTDSERREWFAHSVRDDEFLESYDGLKLHALRLTNHPEAHKWIILIPGVGSFSGDMMDYMYEADHRDCNVLAIDQRGCGMSSGKYTGLGWNEHYDLISWINYLLNIDPIAKIALVGQDAGAAAVMNAVGDYIPSNVLCAVEDSGFSGVKEMILHGIRSNCKMDGRPFIPTVDFYVRQMLHFSMNDVSTKRQLSQSAVPMMFIHGTEDNIVPCSMLFDNYYACSSEKELYTVEGAGFRETSLSPGYYDRVFDFILKYLG